MSPFLLRFHLPLEFQRVWVATPLGSRRSVPPDSHFQEVPSSFSTAGASMAAGAGSSARSGVIGPRMAKAARRREGFIGIPLAGRNVEGNSIFAQTAGGA